ncbi:sulfotransferase [Microbacterium sp. AR7-10]|uniref:sulfotransferase family protein n=1 Tax=Microbacterium sp. AR7-10 TaxID=1891970 RepID=UPI0009F6D2F4|nr:sulfotransferase domain-containing protein [Microbacterium sp. AR7-10]
MMPKDALMRLRPLALKAIDSTASATAPLRMLPSFLIVGGQRCGTTSLFKTLAQHRSVARPFALKGVHYFDTHFDHTFNWYRGHFPLRLTSRLKRLAGPAPTTGESSPFYGFHPLAPQRIAEALPGVRLILLMRDPVTRAYSAHSHEKARGFEDQDFITAIELEQQRIAGERERMIEDPSYVSFSLQHHAYMSRGRYIEQIQALEAAVGRDHLHLVDSHEFFTDPESTFADILRFLSLTPHSGIKFERHNARERNPLDGHLREDLLARFEETDQRLSQWWGRAPSWRR